MVIGYINIENQKDAHRSGYSEPGNDIVAANAGKVILAKYYGGYGNTVIIDHGGKNSLYAHNSKLRLKKEI